MHSSFLPGENIFINEDWVVKVNPTRENIKFAFPSRIHMSPIDCNEFDFGKPGGGGYGFAIGADNIISINLSEKKFYKVELNQLPIVKHYVEIMKKIFCYEGDLGFDIKLDKGNKQHFGLGSTAMISCAVVWGINGLFGFPLSKKICRDIVTKNFCEGFEGKRLMKGLDTGLGTHLCFNGGFAVIGDDAEVIFTEPMPDSFYVVLIDNGSRRPGSDLPESIEMVTRSRELDSYYRYYKSYVVLMNIIPAIKQGDWIKFGKFNFEFQFAGTHLSMIQSYHDNGFSIFNDIISLKKMGAILTGMSSVGPAIFAVVNETDSIIKYCNEFKKEYSIYRPDNLGIKEI